MKRTCNVIGCNEEHHAKGYCKKHYQQFKRGILTEATEANTEVKSVIPTFNSYLIKKNSYATLVVSYNDDSIFFDIDLEDIEEVKKHDWKYDLAHKICYYYVGNKKMFLHRILMNIEDQHVWVLFKDDNTFNCRKENLLVVLRNERKEYDDDRDAFIAKKEQQNNKSYGSTPVIEKQKQNYTDILKTDDGKYVMVSENKQCTIFTKEEIESKILELFNSDPTRFLEFFE